MLFANGNLLIIREHPSDRTHDESVPETSNRLRWLRWLDYVPNTNPNVPTLTLIYTDGWNSGSQLKGQHTCGGQTELGYSPAIVRVYQRAANQPQGRCRSSTGGNHGQPPFTYGQLATTSRVPTDEKRTTEEARTTHSKMVPKKSSTGGVIPYWWFTLFTFFTL